MRNTKINWENGTADEIRALHRCEGDRVTARRLFCMMKISEGRNVAEVSEIMEVSTSSIQRWIKTFNSYGLEGLLARGEPGRKKSISVSEFAKDIAPVLENPGEHNQDHWTAIKLHGHLKDSGKINCAYSTLVRSLHENKYSLVVPRPTHPQRDETLREQFIEELCAYDRNPDVEIFFSDEAGFEGDPRPRSKWVKRGTKPTCQRTGCHVRTNVIGAVAPKSGELFSLIVPQTDTQVFQIFLDEFAKCTAQRRAEGRKIVLVLDNASWHKSASLNWHDITPFYLPPYSPDLNPIEQLWRDIKSHWLPNWFTSDEETLIRKIHEVLSTLMTLKSRVAKITSYDYMVN